MKNRRIFDIFIFCFIIALLVGFGYQFIKNQSLKEDMNRLQTNKSQLEDQINAISKENNTLKNQIESLNYQINYQPKPEANNKTCTFIRTFHYIDTLEYKQVPEEQWIIFQAFQDNPFLLRLNNNFGVNFEKDAAYEITFTGPFSNGGEDLNLYTITSIKKTNKVGLEQLQEPCRVEE